MQVIQSGEHLVTLYRQVFQSDAGQAVLDHLKQCHQQPLQQWVDNTNQLCHAAGRSDVITGIENVIKGHIVQFKEGERTYDK